MHSYSIKLAALFLPLVLADIYFWDDFSQRSHWKQDSTPKVNFESMRFLETDKKDRLVLVAPKQGNYDLVNKDSVNKLLLNRDKDFVLGFTLKAKEGFNGCIDVILGSSNPEESQSLLMFGVHDYQYGAGGVAKVVLESEGGKWEFATPFRTGEKIPMPHLFRLSWLKSGDFSVEMDNLELYKGSIVKSFKPMGGAQDDKD